MTDTLANPITPVPDGLLIESLDLDAQGIAHKSDGKVVFVEGALPFEYVSAKILRQKNNWEQGCVTQIHQESSQRVRPKCPHFGLHTGACGGCKMQHLEPSAQVAAKQRALEDNLWHLGKVRPETILRPIQGPTWGYRYRARLSVRYVQKRAQVLIGFHERKSRYVADMAVCPVLPAAVSQLLLPLRALIESLQARETCPQIELACGDQVMALVLRHLQPLSAGDQEKLRAFAQQFNAKQPLQQLQWWLQPKGPETVHLLDAQPAQQLAYALPDFGITMPFRPTDFTQVNPAINQVLVTRALRLLAVQPHERVIDWFCGLGNFTLPLATLAREVLGVEGSDALVARSRQNYAANQVQRPSASALAPTDFVARNLFAMSPDMLLQDRAAEKWLVDPPREGAFALAKALVNLYAREHGLPEIDAEDQGTEKLVDPPACSTAPKPSTQGWQPPLRIVYVSCNPSTLARDAGLLVHRAGYRCTAAGMVNMFPHTAHVESIAVFDYVGPVGAA